MITINCFILSYVKYGDHDAVLHCFCEECGFQSFFAKGIYSSKNKKKPYLFPLNLLNITLSKTSNHQSISNVSKIELAPGFYDFNEVKINSILFFAADFLHQILRNEAQNQVASFYDFRYMPQSLKMTQTGYWNYRVSRLANHEYSQELNTSEILNLSQNRDIF